MTRTTAPTLENISDIETQVSELTEQAMSAPGYSGTLYVQVYALIARAEQVITFDAEAAPHVADAKAAGNTRLALAKLQIAVNIQLKRPLAQN